MNELIKIETKNEKQYVWAKELYEKLGLLKKHWSRWSNSNIDENPFFKEGEDYEGFPMVVNGNITKDYILSLQMAKHICAQTNTARAHEYREYLFKVEQAWNTPEMIIKRALEFANKRAEEATQKLLENKHKIEFYDEVLDSGDSKTTTELAQEFGMTTQKLNKLLKDWGVQYYRAGKYFITGAFVSKGYHDIRKYPFTDKEGKKRVNEYMVWTQKGKEFIYDLLKENLMISQGL